MISHKNKRSGREINFGNITDPLGFSKKIKNNKIRLQHIKKYQRNIEGSIKNYEKESVNLKRKKKQLMSEDFLM